MTQMVLEIDRLQEFLKENITTSTVKVIHDNDQIILIPNEEAKKHKSGCKWIGKYKSDRSIVDEAIALRRSDPRN